MYLVCKQEVAAKAFSGRMLVVGLRILRQKREKVINTTNVLSQRVIEKDDTDIIFYMYLFSDEI